MGMATYYTASSTGTMTTNGDTYVCKYPSPEEPILKKKPVFRDVLADRLKSFPVFLNLYDLGILRSASAIWVSENHFGKLNEAINHPDILKHVFLNLVSTDCEGLFFKVTTGFVCIVIYGVFDTDASVLTKANFIKKAAYYLPSSGYLVLLSDNNADGLRDLIALTGIQYRGEIKWQPPQDVTTKGIILVKE